MLTRKRFKSKPKQSDHDHKRISDYYERNWWLGWNSKGPQKHAFCFDCESLTCNDLKHRRMVLNPIIRIPKQNAGKKKWKEFYDVVRYFHGDYLNKHKFVVARGLK